MRFRKSVNTNEQPRAVVDPEGIFKTGFPVHLEAEGISVSQKTVHGRIPGPYLFITGKHSFHRQHRLLQPARILQGLELIQGPAVLHPESGGPGAQELFHAPAHSQPFSDVMAEGPDIRSLGAGNGHDHLRQPDGTDGDVVDLHRSGLPLHLHALAGQIAELPSVDLQGRVHGRDLVIIPHKA